MGGDRSRGEKGDSVRGKGTKKYSVYMGQGYSYFLEIEMTRNICFKLPC